MSNFYKWNGGTTQREGLMLRPGQVFDHADYPALDIDDELETGRVSDASDGDIATVIAPEELAHQRLVIERQKELEHASERLAVMAASLRSGEDEIKGLHDKEKEQLGEGLALLALDREQLDMDVEAFHEEHSKSVTLLAEENEQLEKDKALLQSEREVFELEKKAAAKNKKKGGSK